MSAPLAFALAILICLPSSAESPNQEEAATTAQTPCAEADKEAAYSNGYADGLQAGVKLSGDLYMTRMRNADKPLRISLMVEHMDGADLYRFAATEVIHTHFSDQFVVEPGAPFALYITGAQKRLAESQAINVRVVAHVQSSSVAGGEIPSLVGLLVLAEKSWLLRGHARHQRAQRVQEMSYKVLSEFLLGMEQGSK